MSDPLNAAIARLRDAGVDNPRLDARILWKFVQRAVPPPRSGGFVATAYEGQVSDGEPGRGDREAVEGAAASNLFDSLIARRAAREPLAYITGHKEFWSLDFAVGPGALIPRPDTETLIETLIRTIPDRSRPLSVLDLGTGSGCLLIAALTEYPNARGTGIDRSPEALSWAARNLEAHGQTRRAALLETDWPLEASPGYDVILSNPPYIPTADIAGLEPEVSRFEPHAALDGGPDGLDAFRALAPRVAALLAPNGIGLLEIGRGQGEAVLNLMLRVGLEVPGIVPDLAKIPRCALVKHRTRPI